MHSHSTQETAAAVLTELLTLCPAVAGLLSWKVTPDGNLSGERPDDPDGGRVIDRLARGVGGTVERLTAPRHEITTAEGRPERPWNKPATDWITVAGLTTVWRGIRIDAWASYPESGSSGPDGQVAAERARAAYGGGL